MIESLNNLVPKLPFREEGHAERTNYDPLMDVFNIIMGLDAQRSALSAQAREVACFTDKKLA